MRRRRGCRGRVEARRRRQRWPGAALVFGARGFDHSPMRLARNSNLNPCGSEISSQPCWHLRMGACVLCRRTQQQLVPTWPSRLIGAATKAGNSSQRQTQGRSHCTVFCFAKRQPPKCQRERLLKAISRDLTSHDILYNCLLHVLCKSPTLHHQIHTTQCIYEFKTQHTSSLIDDSQCAIPRPYAFGYHLEPTLVGDCSDPCSPGYSRLSARRRNNHLFAVIAGCKRLRLRHFWRRPRSEKLARKGYQNRTTETCSGGWFAQSVQRNGKGGEAATARLETTGDLAGTCCDSRYLATGQRSAIRWQTVSILTRFTKSKFAKD